jgi:hypothetical protein
MGTEGKNMPAKDKGNIFNKMRAENSLNLKRDIHSGIGSLYDTKQTCPK